MSRIMDLMDDLTTLILSEVDTSKVVVTVDAGEVRPALEDGLIVVWVTPPAEIEYLTGSVIEATLEPIVLSPTTDDPIAGLAEIEPVAARIAIVTEAERVRFDTLTLGASASFPAAQIITTITSY